MPNAISPTKRSITYLENREVLEWMEGVAQVRKTTVSEILREATSTYYTQHKELTHSPDLFTTRAATKASQRAETTRLIAEGRLSPAAAQEKNAPIHQAVEVINLRASVNRYARARARE